ncbi:MAG: cell division ATP-binding protein FtsE, partial [Gaiellaceae bacterium]
MQEADLTERLEQPGATAAVLNGADGDGMPATGTGVEPVGEAQVPGGSPMIVFEAVTKVYDPNVVALREASFVIEKGEFDFLVGPSGSGKSTIMRLLLKELDPTRGRILVGGRELARLKGSKVPMLRRNLGCVFQDFKLLTDRTAYE